MVSRRFCEGSDPLSFSFLPNPLGLSFLQPPKRLGEASILRGLRVSRLDKKL